MSVLISVTTIDPLTDMTRALFGSKAALRNKHVCTHACTHFNSRIFINTVAVPGPPQRIQRRSVEEIAGVLVPRILEQIVEAITMVPQDPVSERNVERIHPIPQERVSYCAFEQTVDAAVPQIREPAAKDISQERLQQYAVERLVDVPVPQIFEKL